MSEETKKVKKTKKDWFDSFTKIAVGVILANAVAWVWCSYILAYLGRYEIAETLSETAISVILGTFITYAVKSLVENISKYGVSLSNVPKLSGSGRKTTVNTNRDY